MPTYTIQHVRAPNNSNGNPCRLYLVTHLEEGKSGAFDEGYSGRHAVPEWLWDMAYHLPHINVSAIEYRGLLRAHDAREF